MHTICKFVYVHTTKKETKKDRDDLSNGNILGVVAIDGCNDLFSLQFAVYETKKAK